MKLNRQQSGFTLVEVIISMAIIVMVVFASTNLLVSIIRSNAENTHTLIAYGLSQEGLEAVRNMRDSDWLLGAGFDGVIHGQADSMPWGATFPSVVNDKHFYTVDFKHFETGSSTSAQNLFSMSSPWVLTDITDTNSTDEKTYAQMVDTALYTNKDDEGDVLYTHDHVDDPTLYHRYISIEQLPYSLNGTAPSGKFLKMRVTSVVSWKEQSRDKEVRLTTELTDWKP